MTANNIALTIVATVAKGDGSWAHIMQAIEDRGLAPKNWMVVRNMMQELINDGFIVRENDVFVEKYKLADAKPIVRRDVKIQVGTMIKHPARKQPMKVIEITPRGSLHIQGSGGGIYRLTMDEAKKYAIG